jgi:hypothetical protein
LSASTAPAPNDSPATTTRSVASLFFSMSSPLCV